MLHDTAYHLENKLVRLVKARDLEIKEGTQNEINAETCVVDPNLDPPTKIMIASVQQKKLFVCISNMKKKVSVII